MRVFTEQVTESATLTGYVQDGSDELSSARVRPAVLVLPGGGYEFCSDREAEPIALAYLAEGFNAFVLRYAVGKDAPWERSFADGQAGLAWLRGHAGEVDIDPARIAAVGFSAGGHLAASLGTADEGRPDALVLGYPVTLGEFGTAIGKEILDVPSAVDGEYPPTFVFSTQGDTLVPIRNSIDLLASLAAHDVAFESHIYLLGGHGLSLAKPLTANGSAGMTDVAVAHWLPDSVQFLLRVFGDFAAAGAPGTWAGLQERRRIGLDMPVGRLLAHPDAVAVLARHLPAVMDQLQANPIAGALTLRELAGYTPGLIEDAALDALGTDLSALNS